jgi:hypothetical protein
MEMCLKRLHIAECLLRQIFDRANIDFNRFSSFLPPSMENDSPFSAHDCARAHTTPQPNRVTMAGAMD